MEEIPKRYFLSLEMGLLASKVLDLGAAGTPATHETPPPGPGWVSGSLGRGLPATAVVTS